MDEESRQVRAEEAGLRRISVSDYVRTVTVAQARREVLSAKVQTIQLNPGRATGVLAGASGSNDVDTPAQKRLRKLMRGEA